MDSSENSDGYSRSPGTTAAGTTVWVVDANKTVYNATMARCSAS